MEFVFALERSNAGRGNRVSETRFPRRYEMLERLLNQYVWRPAAETNQSKRMNVNIGLSAVWFTTVAGAKPSD